MDLIERCVGLPEALVSLVEAAVVEALKGGETPATFSRVCDWLEGPGAIQLIEGEDPTDFALSLGALYLSDDELRSHEGLSDDELLSDADRLRWARSHLRAVAEQCDGYDVPSVHSRCVTTANGCSALLGYRIEIHGQGGPVVVVDGVYTGWDQYDADLRSNGFWPSSGLNEIPDGVLLERWEV